MGITLARSSLRYSLHHPWQLALSLLGIALGVAVVVAIDLSSVSAEKAFAASNRGVLGSATHQIVGGPSGLDETDYVTLKTLARPAQAAPIVEGWVGVEGIDGRAFIVLGVDPFAEAPMRSHLSEFGSQAGGVGDLLTKRNAALLGGGVATTLGIKPGEPFLVHVAGRTVRMQLVGLLAGGDALQAQHSSNVIIVDIATAQILFARQGALSRIDLVMPPMSDSSALLTRISAALPSGARLIGAPARTQATLEMTRAFRLNLLMLSLLALLVGMFLIYNTMNFSVVQRHALIGNLRALGVNRRQIFVLILSEALLVGLIGAGIGVVLGVVLATELVKLVAQTINDLYFVLEVTHVAVPWMLLAKGLLIGTLASVVAAGVPAFEATRVAPRVAQLRSVAETRLRLKMGRLAALGAILMLSSVAILLLPSKHLAPGFVALFLMVVGFTLLTPMFAVGFVATMRPVSRIFSATLGPLAVRGVSASLSRSSVAIAALMVALATTVGVGVMVDSFRDSLDTWLSTTLQADVYVTVPGPKRFVIDERIVARIERLDVVRELSMGRSVEVQTVAGSVEVISLKMAADSYQGFRFVEGDAGVAWGKFDNASQVLVTEPYAWHHGVGVGDQVRLETDHGPHAFTVAGVVRDYGSEQGALFMSHATFEAWWDERGFSTVGVYANAGADLEQLVVDIEQAANGIQDVFARSNRAIRTASMQVFDRTFTITTVLQVLATAIAFVGVLSALMAIQLERQREIAVLRALGMTRGQVWSVITAQTGLMGTLAGLLCLPLGLTMAVMLTDVINRRSFGWSIDLSVDPAALLQALGLAVVAALLAGVYPAIRMTRSEPALALRED